jgi:DNA polymerase-3 subunit beta
MVATDGHRLAIIERKGEFGEPIDVIIQRKALTELAKLCAAGDEILQIGTTDNKIHFKLGARRMTSRLLTGDYPNYSAILPKENHRRFTVGREPVLSAIKRAAIMVGERQRAIKIEIGNGEMRISSESSENGEAIETVPIDYSGEAITAGFNSVYLSDFLTSTNEEELSFEFKDGHSPAQLRYSPSSQDRHLGVVMPMRW